MGVDIKVETNGSSGAKNVLTPDEIANAQLVIVAKRYQGGNGAFQREACP